MQTTQEHLKAAFEALLRGDTDERDRQCKLAEEALEREPADRAEKTFYGAGLPLIHAAQKILRRRGAP